MKRELDKLLAPAGFTFAWREPGENFPPSEHLIIAELRGDCGAPGLQAPATAPKRRVRLASTAVDGDQIQPFTWIDCAAVGEFLSLVRAKSAAGCTDTQYGRVLGRLFAHEFYHVLTGARSHARRGVAREHVAPEDLLAGDFSFDPSTISAFLSSN
jgi:hypothetical protein